MERSARIDRENPVESVVGIVRERSGDREAGIADKDIEPAKPLHRIIDCRVLGSRVRDVTLQRVSLSAFGLQRLYKPLCLLRTVLVEYGEVCALFCKAAADG